MAYYASAPPVHTDELLRIRERMVCRGPDGAGLWISPDRCVGLAHRRLAILDLSEAGAQPMATPDDRLHIVFNGEIYNYRALRRHLEVAGYRFRSTSDTEVLLYGYREYGQNLVHHLRGMYAFALWDEERRGLWLARDPYGIKPLYYADDGATLRVASQVKALLAGGAVDTSPDPAGHAGFFVWGHVPDPFTLYRGIRALPAGHTLWVGDGKVSAPQAFLDPIDILIEAERGEVPTDGANILEPCVSRRLPRAKSKGSPASCADHSGHVPASRTEMRDHLRRALLDSVGHHLIADVPVGVFLSAGIDSNVIAALARETGVDELRTVTLGFDEYRGSPDDEAPLAELAAERLGARHTTRRISRQDFAAAFDDLLEAMDQPSIDGVNAYFVSKAAADSGLKVVLSGLGGDELFRGYSHFNTIPRWVRAIRPFHAIPALGFAVRHVGHAMLGARTALSPKTWGLLEYGGSYEGAYLLRRSLYMPWELPEVLDADFARAGWNDLQTIPRLAATAAPLAHPELRVAAMESVWYMRNQLLRDSDWASMAHSLELRVPLVDMELLRKLAPYLASPLAPGKRDLAAVPVQPLPPEIVDRRKTGFSIPVAEWLRERVPDRPREGYRGWARFLYRQFTENR